MFFDNRQQPQYSGPILTVNTKCCMSRQSATQGISPQNFRKKLQITPRDDPAKHTGNSENFLGSCGAVSVPVFAVGTSVTVTRLPWGVRSKLPQNSFSRDCRSRPRVCEIDYPTLARHRWFHKSESGGPSNKKGLRKIGGLVELLQRLNRLIRNNAERSSNRRLQGWDPLHTSDLPY